MASKPNAIIDKASDPSSIAEAKQTREFMCYLGLIKDPEALLQILCILKKAGKLDREAALALIDNNFPPTDLFPLREDN
jgi:hypothetical protein